MANQQLLQLFPDGWAADRVKRQILRDESTEGGNGRPEHLLRVAEFLRNADPGSYNPKKVSFGPYRANEGLNQEFKVKSVADCLQFIAPDSYEDERSSLDKIVAKIEAEREMIAEFYQCSIPEGEYCKNFALMIMVDAFFILQFIIFRNSHDPENDIRDTMCDILKLENQIPLYILATLFKLLGPVASLDKAAYFLIKGTYHQLSPFEIVVPEIENKERHLLAGFHTAVSPFLRIQDAKLEMALHTVDAGGMTFPVNVLPPKATLFQIICHFLQVHLVEKLCMIFFLSTHKRNDVPINGYTASELGRAGIIIKSFTRPDDHIWFDKYSHTLYLPRMRVTSPLTEVFFRNLCAFEFNTKRRGEHVRSFIQLMACLINNFDDIATLRNSDVICLQNPLHYIHDRHLVDMWKDMHRPFSTISFSADPQHPGEQKYAMDNIVLELPKELKGALHNVLTKKCCIIKCRIALSKLCQEYQDQYLSKPWKVVALLVGFFILAMNTVQAYCSLWECSFNHSKKSS